MRIDKTACMTGLAACIMSFCTVDAFAFNILENVAKNGYGGLSSVCVWIVLAIGMIAAIGHFSKKNFTAAIMDIIGASIIIAVIKGPQWVLTLSDGFGALLK